MDDPIPFQDLDSVVESKKPYDVESLQSKVSQTKYSVYIPTYTSTVEEKVRERFLISNSYTLACYAWEFLN